MILRTIKCSKKGCRAELTEAKPNAGWPGWGHIGGLINEHGETNAHLCPEHMEKVKIFLNNNINKVD